MTNKNPKKKAEDILSEDTLIERLLKDDLPPEQFPEEEVVIAREILKSVDDDKIIFSPEHKELLDNRIIDSIDRHKRNKLFAVSGIAAGILLLVSLTFLFQMKRQPEISRFASAVAIQPGYEYTQLILADKKEVQIRAEESKIKYSENGAEVKIDTLKKVGQQVETSGATYNTLVVPYGKRARITLSDSSTIWINSGSKLIYPAKFTKEKREVYLEGEAMFYVHHDEKNPFYVLTHNLDVKVLGTIFNISAYRDDQTVSTVLEQGSVELHYDNRSIFGSSVEKMVPGMLAVYDPAKNTLLQTKVNTKDYTSWKDGYVILEKCPLDDIIRRLSRYYNIPIELDDQELAHETFSGYLDLRNSATQVLDTIAEMINIEIIRSGDQIKIKKKQKPV